MQNGTAIVAGTTGLVGRQCLALLLDHPLYARVVAVGRRRVGVVHPKLEEHVIDFERLAEGAELLAGDDVFCCLGTTMAAAGSREAFRRVDHDYVVELARVGRAQAVRRFFLVSALGADASSRVFYSRVKGEAERDVGALDFEAVHIVRPSLLLGRRRDRRPAEAVGQILARLAAPLFWGPLRRYRALPAREVAECLVAAADSDERGVSIHYP